MWHRRSSFHYHMHVESAATESKFHQYFNPFFCLRNERGESCSDTTEICSLMRSHYEPRESNASIMHKRMLFQGHRFLLKCSVKRRRSFQMCKRRAYWLIIKPVDCLHEKSVTEGIEKGMGIHSNLNSYFNLRCKGQSLSSEQLRRFFCNCRRKCRE